MKQLNNKNQQVILNFKHALFFTIVFLLFAALTSIDANASIKTPKQQFSDKFKATFNQNTFGNFEPAPIDGLFQMEISNQIVYFDPKSELIIFGEIFDKNGISISAQTKENWNAKKIKDIELKNSITIGNGAIEIIEFTDPDCPFCQKFDNWINAKSDEYKKQTGKDLFTRKVVMSPILQLHPNASKESIHLLCQESKKYKETLSNLINNKIAYSDMQSCENGKKLLTKHKETAKDFGVVATPTLILDGKLIQGFNQEKLEETLRNLLKKNIAITGK